MSFYGFARAVARPFVKVLFRYKLEGRENIPEGSFVLCANHVSLLDPVCLVCAFKPKLSFMAKTELNKGILGKVLKKAGMIFVNRQQADLGAIRQCVDVLKNGGSVGIFPQGTRVKGKVDASQGLEGISMICTLGRAQALPVAVVYPSGKAGIFRKTRLIVGKPISTEEFAAAGDRTAQSQYIFGKVCDIINDEEN